MINKIKSISKRTLALLLAVMTIMSVGITNIIALDSELAETGATTYTVYFYNANSWGSVYCYTWNSETAGEWPGTAMTALGNDYYSYSSTTKYENIIFNSGSNVNQTSDLATDGNWEKVHSGKEGGWFDPKPAAPTEITIESVTSDVISGSGTSADPYKIPVGAAFDVTMKATHPATNADTYTEWKNATTAVGTLIAKDTSYTYNETAASTAQSYEITYYAKAMKYLGTNDNKVGLYSTGQAEKTIHIQTYVPEYEIIVSANNTAGGSVETSDDSITPGSNVTLTAAPKTEEGYEFTGWEITGDYEEEGIDLKSSEITITPTSDITAEANFSKIKYTVTFVDYDGTELKKQENVEWGTAATAPADPANRPGWTFKAWDTDFTSVKGDITVKAVYTQDNYTITFKDWDGTVLKSYNDALYGDALIKPETNPTRDGYTFTGWSPSIVDPVTGNATYTAQYTINKYAVSVSVKDDSSMGSVTINGSDAASLEVDYDTDATLVAAPAENHKFVGWFIGEECVGTDTTYVLENVKAATEVVAQFAEKDKYTLTFKQSVEGSETMLGQGTTIGDVPVSTKEYSAEFYEGTEVSMYFYAPTEYYVKHLYINEVDFADDTTKYHTPYWWVEYNQPVNGNTTVEVVYTDNPTITIQSTDSNAPKTATVAGVDVNNKYDSVTYKDELEYVIEAPSGFYIKKIEGTYVDTFNNNNQTYTKHTANTNPVAGDSVIYVTFAEQEFYTVTFENSDTNGGSVSYDTLTQLNYGAKVTFTASQTTTQASDYDFGYWTVDGVKQTAGTTLELTVTGNHKVMVYWQKHEWQGGIYVEDGHTTQLSGINIYTWKLDTTNEYTGGFPGTAMIKVGTNNGHNVYYLPIDAPEDVVNNNQLMFILSGGTQTSNLTFDPAKNYYVYKDGAATGSWNTNFSTKSLVILDYGAKVHDNALIGTSEFITTEGVTISNEQSGAGSCFKYITGTVEPNTVIEFKTTVNDSNYRVDGWVVNGEYYTKCNNISGQVYSGSYEIGEGTYTIVPIYFHTDNYLTTNKISTTTLYVYMDEDNPVNTWDKYMSSYVWKVKGEAGGGQFGTWPGQLMIPMTAVSGGYYTYVETFKNKGETNEERLISGITFNNYGGSSPVVGYSDLQTYDYDEFIKFINMDYENISCVLKPRDGSDYTYNYKVSGEDGKTIGSTYANLETTFDFEYLTEQSGKRNLDIFREETTSNEVGLYIVRCAPVDTGNYLNYDAQYAVECFVYNSDKKCIAKVNYSSLLLDFETYGKETLGLSDDDLKALEGKAVKVAYEKFNEKDGGSRYDAEWYADDKNREFDLSVKVALDENDDGVIDLTSDVDDDNITDYGEAFINDGASASVVINTQATIKAYAKAGFKFVGWYTETGERFTKDSIFKPTAAKHTVYYAVFAPLGSGVLLVNHSLFIGNDEMKGSQGSAQYSVKIEDANGNVLSTGTTSAQVSATENDVFYITIGTDAIGKDQFLAWYADAVAGDDSKHFEEVGVYSADNLYTGNPEYYVGSSDPVYFKFKYVFTGDNESEVLNLYSDIKPITEKITITYIYYDRYDKRIDYTVPYTMTSEELEAGRPDDAKIIEFAPYIGDLYKNACWTLDLEGYYDHNKYEYYAYQPPKTYTVMASVNGKIKSIENLEFNDEIVINAREVSEDKTLSNKGKWVDSISGKVVAYGTYYALRVTDNVSLTYVTDDSIDFSVVIDDPVYGREQQSNGTDIIYVDYLTSLLVPYFRGDSDKNGTTFDKVYFEGDEIVSIDSPVTIETLTEYGYTVDYGIMLEQVASCKESNYENYEAMLEAAKAKGYGEESTYDALKAMAEKYYESADTSADRNVVLGFDDAQSKYYYAYTGTVNNITNKNRILMTFNFNNKESVRSRFYNVYGYLIVKDTKGNVEYYFSDAETLNIYLAGTSDVVRDENTFS